MFLHFQILKTSNYRPRKVRLRRRVPIKGLFPYLCDLGAAVNLGRASALDAVPASSAAFVCKPGSAAANAGTVDQPAMAVRHLALLDNS